jgi:predicted porin
MTKKLGGCIALLGLAACGAASAQSSLVIYGTVDIVVQRIKQGGVSNTIVNGFGGNAPSRIGFAGTEDLGGGDSANFVLEAGMNADNGTGQGVSTNNQSSGTSAGPAGLLFNRRSYVGFTSASLGEVRVGREYLPTYWNVSSLFDPFTNVGAGALNHLTSGALTQNTTPLVQTAARASNAVTYLTPKTFGGFYGQVMYALGENPSNVVAPVGKNDGDYIGGRLGYGSGPLSVAVAQGVNKFLSGNVTITNFAVSYDFGFIKPRFVVFRDKKDAVVAPTAANASSGYMLAATVPVGSGYIPMSYGTVHNNRLATPGNLRATQIAIGYVYKFSKRTSVYATYANISNKNGAALSGGTVIGVANASWDSKDVGLRFDF